MMMELRQFIMRESPSATMGEIIKPSRSVVNQLMESKQLGLVQHQRHCLEVLTHLPAMKPISWAALNNTPLSRQVQLQASLSSHMLYYLYLKTLQVVIDRQVEV